MSGFTYKGIDIGNQITSYDSNAPTFSKYNLQHTPTNYLYQRPLPFNLSDGGTSLNKQCTATQITYKSNSSVKYDSPNGATRVSVLLLGGQGGKGGTGGNANAKAINKSAKGNGGGGAVGGFGDFQGQAYDIPEQGKYTITVGKVGNDGNNGNNNTTNGSANGSSTKGGTGGTGGVGGTSSITFYNGNVVDSNRSVAGGPGGGGGNGGDAKANNYNNSAK